MTGVWVSIVKCILKVKVAGTNLVSLSKGEVGNGMDIRFWLDPWACNDTLKERIPTLAALNTRNCRFGSLLCGMCDQHEESIGHLLLECEVAMEIWQKIGDWCKEQPLFFFSTTDLFKAHNVEGLGIKEKSVLKGIVFITCWCIWKARNDLRFANITINVDRIFNDIRSIGFLWYRNRGKHRSIMWNDWCGFNLR
uniref:uncharacterized protein LOC122588207 n=1 Tax=Erigeron canadensis TaxID=72917 RepID=UPI001CB99954|nr:uncharacterized protein LOC122588207 [Erigeron canadensis]